MNFQRSITKVVFLSGGDRTPPQFAVSFPRVLSVEDFAATVAVQLDEPGVAYVALVADGDPPPSVAQIQLGLNAAGSSAIAAGHVTVAAGSESVSVALTSGLAASTAYDVYVAAQVRSLSVAHGRVCLHVVHG